MPHKDAIQQVLSVPSVSESTQRAVDSETVRAAGFGMGVAQHREHRLSKLEVAAGKTPPPATAIGQRTPPARTTSKEYRAITPII